MSALGADKTQDPGIPLPCLEGTNTDQMTFLENKRLVTSMTHQVQLKGDWRRRWIICQPSLKDSGKGIPALNNKKELLSNHQLLDGFDELGLRVLVRDSATYAGLQLHLLHPEFLRNGLDRSIELEWLARPLSATVPPKGPHAALQDRKNSNGESRYSSLQYICLVSCGTFL